jgi:hypothetical protein
MRVAIYGRTFDASAPEQVRDLISILEQSGASLIIEEQYLGLMQGLVPFSSSPAPFHRDSLKRGDADYLLSILARKNKVSPCPPLMIIQGIHVPFMKEL